MVKRIVITGATSFIGVHLIKEWVRKDCEIFAVVRPNSNNIDRLPINEKIHIVEIDMSEYDKISSCINRADIFYHLAWEGARAPYRDNVEMQKKNYEYAVVAMDVANALGCKLFVGSGSQAEYGRTKGSVDENYPCSPNTEYGRQKLNACIALAEKAEKYGMRFIWTRIFSIYGQYDYAGTLIMTSVDKMKRNEPIEMTECTQLWDYLHVQDAARAMMMFAQNECPNGVYNIANGNYRPLKEFVKDIQKVLGSQSRLEFGAVPYGNHGPVNLEPNVEKIKSYLKWEPRIEFVEGIRRLMATD